jgi:hypothetical protein
MTVQSLKDFVDTVIEDDVEETNESLLSLYKFLKPGTYTVIIQENINGRIREWTKKVTMTSD